MRINACYFHGEIKLKFNVSKLDFNVCFQEILIRSNQDPLRSLA